MAEEAATYIVIPPYGSVHYYVPGKNAMGQDTLTYRESKLGTILPEEGDPPLREQDVERLILLGAIKPYDENEQLALSAEEGTEEGTEETSVAELAEWIKTEQPNVNETIDASGGDPDRARMLIEAETEATGGDPRKGVVQGLTAVITRAAGE